MGNAEYSDFNSLLSLSPPPTYDSLIFDYLSLSGRDPFTLSPSEWTTRAALEYSHFYSNNTTLSRPRKSPKKYKPVAQRHRPVPTYMPSSESRSYKPIPMFPTYSLPLHPKPLDSLPFNSRMTRERLDLLLSKIEPGLLTNKEILVLSAVLVENSHAFAFEYADKGEFRRDCYPDYEYAVIEHVPWQDAPIPIPKAIIKDVKDELVRLRGLGKFEPLVASYRSALWTVAKKPGSVPAVRLVLAVLGLNSVSVRDSSLPPNINDFAESFPGHAIYMLSDMFSGFDARVVAPKSRPLSTFHSPIGPLQQTTIVQGYTNSIQEFCRATDHVLDDLKVRDLVGNFVDDCGIKGPPSRYNDESIPGNPAIRRFVWEFLHTVEEFLRAIRSAGITVSAPKTILACSRLSIVGSIACLDGWLVGPQLVDKVLAWPIPISVSEIRMFLGLAGGARRWIRGYSLIVYPLTALLSIPEEDGFEFTPECEDAFLDIKKRLTTAPVLVRVDYDLAKSIQPQPRTSNEGLLVVGVDSSWMGAGWVLYQIQDSIKKPSLYGSSTFTKAQQNYGQPKSEVFGVFIALKTLRHRVWGVHFRLEHDAVSLAKMLRSPDDVPNAPMLRWVSWILLFDFETLHVPGASMKMEDALSRAPHIPVGIPDAADDAEEYLDNFDFALDLVRDTYSIRSILEECRIILSSPSVPIDQCPAPFPSILSTDILTVDAFDFTNAFDATLSSHCLSTSMDYIPLSSYRSNYERTTTTYSSASFLLGDELIEMEFTVYAHYVVQSNALDSPDQGHRFGTKDKDDAVYWQELRVFFRTNTYPLRLKTDKERKAFLRRSRRFGLRGDQIYFLPKKFSSHPPRLVIVVPARRRVHILEAHLIAGHKGRDPTYKLLLDRFYWPNMWDDVSWFARSCIECQKAIQDKPVLPYHESWTAPMLRHFDLDTIHMPIGMGGFEYIIHALERTILWPEAKAIKSANAKTVAKFIYDDIICRFSCVPVITMDNGPEFQKEVQHLLATQYRCTVVFSTPYHPEGNAPVERNHNVLVSALFKLAGDAKGTWPRFLTAGLFAIRVTVTRSHGFSPFYLLYGQHPVFSFDIEEHTWTTLDWDQVTSHEDLIEIRSRQFARRDKDMKAAIERQRETRRRAIDDQAKRHHYNFDFSDYEEGMYVWLRESRLDEIKGGKGEWTYAGPYVIHKRRSADTFILRELSGAVMRAHVNIRRLRLFFFRPEHQTLRAKSGPVALPK